MYCSLCYHHHQTWFWYVLWGQLAVLLSLGKNGYILDGFLLLCHFPLVLVPHWWSFVVQLASVTLLGKLAFPGQYTVMPYQVAGFHALLLLCSSVMLCVVLAWYYHNQCGCLMWCRFIFTRFVLCSHALCVVACVLCPYARYSVTGYRVAEFGCCRLCVCLCTCIPCGWWWLLQDGQVRVTICHAGLILWTACAVVLSGVSRSTMVQVQNGLLYIRYRSNSPKKTKQRSDKSLKTTSLCYSIAKSTLKTLLTFSKVEKTKHEIFDFVYLLSSSSSFFHQA